MSASREKKFRQDSVPGSTDPKTFKELEQQKAEKRSNLLYSIIGVLFLVAVVVCLIWRSNIISRTATAVTIDGEKYTAAASCRTTPTSSAIWDWTPTPP